jgi:HSP20 family protein
MTSLLLRDPLFTEPFRALDEMFGRAFGASNRVTGWVPTMDVRETGDEYLVLLDLPGVKSDDVTIELNDRVLSISGTRVPTETGETMRVERPYGSFVRNLTLPQGVEPDSITADYSDGVLSLHIPKPAEVKPKKIAIGATSQKAIEQ